MGKVRYGSRIPGRGRRLLFPHLGPVHPGIPAVELHQLFVGAFLGDPAIFYQQDKIRIPDGGKPVGDNKGSPPTGCLLYTSFHKKTSFPFSMRALTISIFPYYNTKSEFITRNH